MNPSRYTVLGLCCLASASMAAPPQPKDFDWTGNALNSSWTNGQNWNDFSEHDHPGKDADDLKVYVKSGYNANPFYLANALSNSVYRVFLDAYTAGASMELEIRSGADLNIRENLWVRASDTDNVTATLQFKAGTLDVTTSGFYFCGGDTTSRKAVFDYDGGTLLGGGMVTFEFYGHAELDTEVSFHCSNRLICASDSTIDPEPPAPQEGHCLPTVTFGVVKTAEDVAVTAGTIQIGFASDQDNTLTVIGVQTGECKSGVWTAGSGASCPP